jgi:hypothetical protein
MLIMFDLVWQRIVVLQGQQFTQIRGRVFTYRIVGNSIRLGTTNQNISQGELVAALQFVPLNNTVIIQHLRAPSYIYAILMDNRIRNGLW